MFMQRKHSSLCKWITEFSLQGSDNFSPVLDEPNSLKQTLCRGWVKTQVLKTLLIRQMVIKNDHKVMITDTAKSSCPNGVTHAWSTSHVSVTHLPWPPMALTFTDLSARNKVVDIAQLTNRCTGNLKVIRGKGWQGGIYWEFGNGMYTLLYLN